LYAGSEQEHHRHRIEDSNKRQREQAHRSLKVGCRYAHQLGEISHRTDVGVGVGAPALSVNPGFLDLQASECLPLPLPLRNDVGALAALLVSDRHRTERAALPRRFPDGRVNLGDAPIEVGDGLALDGEASLGVGGSVRKRRIDSCHMIEVGAREEAEHADRPS
jgi:hypothetical protein